MNGLYLALFLLVATPFSAGASPKVLQHYVPSKKKMLPVEVIEHKAFEITKSCINGTSPKCQAWEAAQSKPARQAAQVTPLLGHPAANYCKSVGGTNYLYLDKKTEIDFCEFKDGSAVNSWDLFNAHH